MGVQAQQADTSTDKPRQAHTGPARRANTDRDKLKQAKLSQQIQEMARQI